MNIKLINKSQFAAPAYATLGAAGLDLQADLSSSITIESLDHRIIPTGLFIELPLGYEAQIRPRSGLAAKQGLTVLNTPGTIDADYRGEIGVILVNLSQTPQTINPGDRIAQMVVAKHERVEWEFVAVLGSTERGAGGFGSTGK